MRGIHGLLLLLFFNPLGLLAQEKSRIPLKDLVQDKKVGLEAEARGGLGENNLILNIQNLTDRTLDVVSEPGLWFRSEDPGAQDLLIVEPLEFSLRPGEGQEILTQGYCTQLGNYAPGKGDRYLYKGYAEHTLGALTGFLADPVFSEIRQQAIWVVTDNYRAEETLYFYAWDSTNLEVYQKLAGFLFEELGRKVEIDYKSGAPRKPTTEVLSIRGVFCYQVAKAGRFTFLTVDEQGDPVHTYFKDRLLQPGLKFYTFGINQIIPYQSGPRYFTRIIDDQGNILQEEPLTKSTKLEARPVQTKKANIHFEIVEPLDSVMLNVYKPTGELLMEYKRYRKLGVGEYNLRLDIQYFGVPLQGLKVKVEGKDGRVHFAKVLD